MVATNEFEISKIRPSTIRGEEVREIDLLEIQEPQQETNQEIQFFRLDKSVLTSKTSISMASEETVVHEPTRQKRLVASEAFKRERKPESPKFLSLELKMKKYSPIRETDKSSDKNNLSPSHLSVGSERQKKCLCQEILVVDDNEFNIQTLTELLEEHFKVHCDVAVHGQDAVDKFRESMHCCPYRLVFMDVNMPIMDGKEATR